MRYPAYPAYKDSGVEWLGEVPEHWEVKRLKYSASINDDTLPETTDPEFEFSYVDIGSVNSVEGITQTEQMIFDTAPSRARRCVSPGDTIVSTVRTYLKAIAPILEAEETIIVSTGFAVVRPRQVNAKFLKWALRETTFVETVVARSVGVSYPAVNASEIGCIHIPLPTSNEQQTIADFLDVQTAKIDVLLAKKREVIEKLKEKRTALISRTVTRGLPPEAAYAAGLDPNPPMKASGIDWLGEVPEGWNVSRIKYIKDAVPYAFVDGPFGSNLKTEHFVTDGDVFVIESGFATSGELNEDNLKQIENEHFETIKRSSTTSGDIIIAKIGASFGLNSILPQLSKPAVVSGNSLKLTVDLKKCINKFIHYQMLHLKKCGAIDLLANATAQPALSLGGMNSLPCFVPPLPEQQVIIDFLDRETTRINLMVSKVEGVIERLLEYRTAQITAAVTGKIDLRGGAA